ncbi:MAG: SDR family oxidoreductase [Kiloniellales bacterium]|nr:SDR family oxidoreductase [Kiloniellales bacterium]
MADLEGKRALVTGSTKGIGRAIAAAFVAQGARAVVHGRDPAEVEAVRAEIGADAGVAGDLATAEGCAQVIAALPAAGEVEILVNNAGIFSVQDFFEIEDEEWLRYYQTNVLSAIRLCRALMPGMLERGRGRIVNVASEAGLRPLPTMIHYSMTKTDLIALSRGLAELTRGSAVTVNSLLPGPTWTAGVESYFEGLAAQEGKPVQEVIDTYFRAHEPTSLIQRFVTAEEVAEAAVFLAANGAVNGSALRVEGGIVRAL